MAQHLAGVRVALTGPRKSKEMSILVEKMGGIRLCDRHRGPYSWMIGVSGMGWYPGSQTRQIGRY